jgi:DNA polymerase III delta prime subunit
MAKIFSSGLSARQPFAAKLIEAQVANNRLAGAYLLTGRAHEDKIQLARELVSALNCSKRAQSVDQFCLLAESETENFCPDCRWIAVDEHPQAWQALGGDDTKSGKIPVEKARALSEELAKTSRYFRAVIIKDAQEEYFHRPAANALLKTIEEVGGRVIFFLFALSASDVLKTVVSRCQIVELRFSEAGLAAKVAADDERELLQKTLSPIREEMTKIGQNRGHAASAPLSTAVTLSQAIQDLVGQGTELATVLDFLVADELSGLRGQLACEPESVRYARDLLQVSERSKLQSDHFVSEKAIIDAFAFRWAALKEKSLEKSER